MRSVVVLSVGAGVIVLGVLLRLLKGQRSANEDVGAVSGQWIAEQTGKPDQSWQ